MASDGFSEPLFVAAIDIGSTHSGYAFSELVEKRIIYVNSWIAGSGSLISNKTPTVLLLNPDKSFKSFGYKAENDYLKLNEDGEHEEYYYFYRFKMNPNITSNPTLDTEIMDITGKSLPAIDVFSHSIRFLKDDICSTINEKIRGQSKSGDIQYVLTLPAIWEDKAKEFMRQAAIKGGIERDQLIIIPEPEAAFTYCKTNPFETRGGNGTYMVVDLGGASANITVLQRNFLGTGIKQLHKTTGCACGEKSVDEEFENFLGEIVGSKTIEKLRKDSKEGFVDLLREFEAKKCLFDPRVSQKVSIVLPTALIAIVRSDKKLQTMQNAIKQSKHNTDQALDFTCGEFRFSGELFKSLFQPTIAGIIHHVEKALYDSKLPHVDTIGMVGGFFECKLV